MSDYLDLTDFLEPLNLAMLSNDQLYHEGQIGKNIAVYEDEFPDLRKVDIVLVGCAEQRGAGKNNAFDTNPADAVRRQFYQLYQWHEDVVIADIGNIRIGSSVQDTYAAVKTVVRELISFKKTVLLVGGSHDLTLAQYEAY